MPESWTFTASVVLQEHQSAGLDQTEDASKCNIFHTAAHKQDVCTSARSSAIQRSILHLILEREYRHQDESPSRAFSSMNLSNLLLKLSRLAAITTCRGSAFRGLN